MLCGAQRLGIVVSRADGSTVGTFGFGFAKIGIYVAVTVSVEFVDKLTWIVEKTVFVEL